MATTVDDDGWITIPIKKKQKEKEKEQKICEPKNNEGYPRLIKNSDFTLTEKETQILKDVGFNCFCICCMSYSISEIIGRRVHPCHKCYCCIGDDPIGDNCDVYLNSETSVSIIAKSNYSNDQYDDNDYYYRKNR